MYSIVSRAKMSKNVVSSFSRNKKQDVPPPKRKKKWEVGSFLSLKSSLFSFLGTSSRDIYFTHTHILRWDCIQVRRRRWWCTHPTVRSNTHGSAALHDGGEKKEKVSGILASFQYGDDGPFFSSMWKRKTPIVKKKKRKKILLLRMVEKLAMPG